MMSQNCGRSELWFLAIFFVLLANSGDMSQYNTAICREGIFQPSKEPMYVNVTEKVLVDSVLECAHLCQAEENCEAFKHRNMYDDVNCQVTQGEPRHLKMLGAKDGKEDWTLHLLQTVESPKCAKKNLCNGAGQCLADSCEPDGFICKCFDQYYGKNCQHKKIYDYDINFPKSSVNNSIVLGVDFTKK